MLPWQGTLIACPEPNGYFNLENIHTRNILSIQQIILSNIHVYTNTLMQAIAMNLQGREKGRKPGSVWKVKKEVENIAIKL